jgi:hypothetical protein
MLTLLLSIFAVVNSQIIRGQSIVMPSINVYSQSNYTPEYINRSYIQMRLTGNLTTRSPRPASAFARASVSASARASATYAKNISSPTSTHSHVNTILNYQAAIPNATSAGAIISSVLLITFIVTFVAIVLNARYHKIQGARSHSSKTIIISNPVNGLIHESYNHSIRKMSV